MTMVDRMTKANRSYSTDQVYISGIDGCLACIEITDYGPQRGAIVSGEADQVTAPMLREFAKGRWPGRTRIRKHQISIDLYSIAILVRV